jgi:hypothetical protein
MKVGVALGFLGNRGGKLIRSYRAASVGYGVALEGVPPVLGAMHERCDHADQSGLEFADAIPSSVMRVPQP